MELRALLTHTFAKRRARNTRYSLRAFARSLDIHHSTLLRVLDGTRGLSAARIAALGRCLQLPDDTVRATVAAEHARKVQAAVRDPKFRPDSRWMAAATGLSVDDVNCALHLLIHTGRLRFVAADAWVSAES